MREVCLETVQYIEIGCGSERFAVAIESVREIIRMQEITELNGCERAYVMGVINLRGSIVPVFNMAERLGLPVLAVTPSTRIVLVRYMEEAVGIMVDHVYRVIRLGEVQPPPLRSGSAGCGVITGVCRTDTGLVSVADVDKLLQQAGGRWGADDGG